MNTAEKLNRMAEFDPLRRAILTDAANELESLTAQLQAAQATIAEVSDWYGENQTHQVYEATESEPEECTDECEFCALEDILSRADTSALAAVKAGALRDAAVFLWGDESAERGTVKAQYNAIYATWLEQRAASIEQAEAE